MSAVIALVLLQAHGGCGGFRGPSGGVPPGLLPPPAPARRMDCWCGTCDVCKPSIDRPGGRRFQQIQKIEITQRWGDLAHVVVTYCFHTIRRDVPKPAVVRINPGRVFAPTKASVRRGLCYVESGCVSKERIDRTCLRVVRKSAGVVDFRIFPVAAGKVTWGVIEGYFIRPPRAGGIRLYRTGNRVLAVGRRIRFISFKTAAMRWPDQAALEVSFVPLLEAAAAGRAKPLVAGNPNLQHGLLGTHPGHEPSDPPPPPAPAPPLNPPRHSG